MLNEQLKKDISKLWARAYGAECIDELLEEYKTKKDMVIWVEQELHFYSTYGFDQYAMKEYDTKKWKENVKQLKDFLKKYKDRS